MIGPGWMPSRPRPVGKKRHLPYGYAYRRLIRRKHAPVAHRGRIEQDQTVLFDLGPGELPVATVVRNPGVVAALRGWLAARWSWLRPRTIPVMAAMIGMFLVIGSARHLSRIAAGDRVACKHKHRVHTYRQEPPAITVEGKPAVVHIQPVKPGIYTVDLQVK